MTTARLPLEIDHIKPANTVCRLNGVRADGIPDGVHTGGAFLTSDKEVWKPLDARPYPNATHRCTTQEDIFLMHCAENGIAMFPMNWRIETLTDQERYPDLVRRFLVRPEAITRNNFHRYGDLDHWNEYMRDIALDVEAAVRTVNRSGWLLNDHLSIALDEKPYEWFILDCSTASPGWRDENDNSYITRWLSEIGADRLLALRTNGREALSTAMLQERSNNPDSTVDMHWHVYASFNRPVSRMWATLPVDAVLVHQKANWDKQIPHTWIATSEPIDPGKVYSYELTLAYASVWSKKFAKGITEY